MMVTINNLLYELCKTLQSHCVLPVSYPGNYQPIASGSPTVDAVDLISLITAPVQVSSAVADTGLAITSKALDAGRACHGTEGLGVMSRAAGCVVCGATTRVTKSEKNMEPKHSMLASESLRGKPDCH